LQAQPRHGGAVAAPARTAWCLSTKMRAGKVLFTVFAGLQFADIITTNSALAVRGNWEANPVMAFAQAHLGEAWWLPKLAILGLIFIAAPLTRRLWPMVFAVSYYTVIVCGNVACF
jgi:Domain of unknown function (DUF5658)